MKKIAIIDARESFLADISTRIMVEDSADFDLVATSVSPEDISKIINKRKPDEIVVSENLLKTQPDWEYGVLITSYAQTAEGINLADNYGLKSYGIITRTDELIDVINKGLFKNIVHSQTKQNNVNEEPMVVSTRQPSQKKVNTQQNTGTGCLPVLEMDFGDGFVEQSMFSNPVQQQSSNQHQVNQNPVYQNPYPQHRANGTQQGNSYPQQYQNQQNSYPQPQQIPHNQGGYVVPVNRQEGAISTSNQGQYQQTTTYPHQYDNKSGQQHHIPVYHQAQGNRYSQPTEVQQGGMKIPNVMQDEGSLLDKMVNEDIRQKSRVKDTKVVSFYAAKGGVGKTTLSSEVAVYLSLMNNGRRKNRVCIIDYNVDFGDVLTTLYLDSNGKNMLYWADDIEDRLKAGEKESDIVYTREEIEYFLQVMDSCGLYALVAPVNHEDSMGLTEKQLEIMLKNLILFGDFDYIVCDTGNNTRDSTIIALDNSDMVFLVVTQDVTTANCNSSFLQAINQVGFDLNKIRLIINDIMPYKDTGISVKELEDNFPNYPCVARIKHNPDVVKANNLGKPLTFNPAHEYTKELRGIVQHITGVIPEKQEKQSLFDKLMKGFKR